ALAVYQGELVAGGDFTMAGGAPAGCIAAWNGSSWRALGPGMVSINQPLGPAVYALAVYKGVLYAAGAFSHVDPWTVNSIARWDGVSWRRVTSGVTGPIGNYIFALHEHDGDLYVGGTFDIAGGFQSRS